MGLVDHDAVAAVSRYDIARTGIGSADHVRGALDPHTMEAVADSVCAGRVHADEIPLNQIVATATCQDAACAVARNDIAGAGGCAADSNAGTVEIYRSCAGGGFHIAAGELAARVGADEIALDHNTAVLVLRSNGGAAKVVNHQPAHHAAAGTAAATEVQAIDPRPIRPVQLYQEHRVVSAGECVRMRMGRVLCVAINDHRLRDRRQLVCDKDRLYRAVKRQDVEGDGVRARRGIGLDDGVVERTDAAVERVGDGERGGARGLNQQECEQGRGDATGFHSKREHGCVVPVSDGLGRGEC